MRSRRTFTLATDLARLGSAPPKAVEIARQRIEREGRLFLLQTYRPPSPTQALLIVPGVQPFHTDDERMDHFARVLANAGYFVALPYLPAHLRLEMVPSAAEDTKAAYDAMWEQPACPRKHPPRVLSISIGSLAAIHTATARPIDELFIFGGCVDWPKLIRFAVSGQSDPALVPVVAINLLPQLTENTSHRECLHEAWLTFIRSTWRDPNKFDPVFLTRRATQIAHDLPPALRELFLQGCGHSADSRSLAEAALASRQELQSIDIRSALSSVSCAVHVVHGLHDNVIPAEQAHQLYELLPTGLRAGLYLSRLYGHSKPTPPRELLMSPGRLASDIRAHWRFSRALCPLAP